MAAAGKSDPEPATYADLEALEKSSEVIDAIATAYQESLSQGFFAKRAQVISRIPGFWPLVFEQAPPEVDETIQVSDSKVIASHLTNFSVSRFERSGGPEDFVAAFKKPHEELSAAQFGEPRSVSFRFEFSENEYFEDLSIEKKFWQRTSVDGAGSESDKWSGLVSEPVKIRWKPGKDLTNGLTDAAHTLWSVQQKKGLLDAKNSDEAKTNEQATKELPEYKSLVQRMHKMSEGGLSFFTWFGYRGPWVSAAQDQAARNTEKQAQAGNGKDADDDGSASEEDLDKMPIHLDAEIFYEGEAVALALAEDVWPNAIRLFVQAQEDDPEKMDEVSEDDFDEADLENMDDEDIAKANMEDIKALSGRKVKIEKDSPPAKKRKTSKA